MVFMDSVQISDEDSFLHCLQCDPDTAVKVISIFGKTGEGKSYTLNHTFFDGCDVFSSHQPSIMAACTSGVWGAYDAVHNAIVLDTEGWLGVSQLEIHHMRHILKVSFHCHLLQS